MSGLRHFWFVFLTEIKRLAAYRVQFWFEVVAASLVELGIAFLVWSAVFEASATERIGGYAFSDMLQYLVLATFTGHAVKGTGIGTFGREIYDGSFTRYLILPLSPYSYKFGLYFPRTCVALGQLAVVLAAAALLGVWPEGSQLSLSALLQYLALVTAASYLYFLLFVATESVSFWADNSWAISAMLQMTINLLSGKLIPIDLFPDWLRRSVELSPLPALVYLPIQAARGTLTWDVWLLGLLQLMVWILIVYLLSRLLIERGLRRYSGVGI